MSRIPNIVQAMTDPKLFEPWFRGPSWQPWITVLRAAYGLSLAADEMTFFRSVADRDPPSKRVRELWLCIGRRAGKDSIASLVAAYTSAFFDAKRAKLRRGERAQVQCLAVDRDQSKIVLGYVRSYFSDCKYLRSLVQRETPDGLELSNAVDIVVATNDYRSVRGRSIALSIFDEVGHWRSDSSASPAEEVHSAIVPGTVNVNGMIVGISTPHKKSGLLYERWREHYGKDGDVLVIKAPSFTFNPLLEAEREFIEGQIAADPAKGRAEWLCEWRSDISSFVDRQLLETAVDRGVLVRPRVAGVRYFGFVDPSGGMNDSMVLAIGHADKDSTVYLDCLVEAIAPFNPQNVVRDMVGVLKEYGVGHVHGDRYAARWTTDCFESFGVKYFHSHRDRSAIYVGAIPIFASGKARLLDSKKLVTQLAGLERKVTPTRDKIDHVTGGADDLANACCGAMLLASEQTNVVKPVPILSISGFVARGDGPGSAPPGVAPSRGSVHWAAGCNGDGMLTPRENFDFPTNGSW